MKPFYCQYGRNLVSVSCILILVITFLGCTENPALNTEKELSIEDPAAIESSINKKIASEIAKAEAKIQDFQAINSVGSQTSKEKRQVIVVYPGESIQSAVDEANPGALILIKPGIYSEAVEINKSGLALIGLGGLSGEEVVIQNPGDEEDGVLVRPAGGAESVDGFAMYNITVRDFLENGVFTVRTHNYFIAHVTTINNGEYGIFPVRSNNGVVFRSSAEGHTDAGIYIGQSENVWILNNRSYANVLGFEVENSSNIVTAHNYSADNTIGILAVLLPPSQFITVLESDNVLIAHNEVVNNNRDNFAEPGELASFIPKGIGLMVIGVDRARVIQNTVRDNDLIGLGLGSTLLFGALAGLPPEAFEDIDPDADNAEIKLNRVLNNGTNPPPLPALLTGIESDLFWDGSGDNNCWWNNEFETSVPSPLPLCSSPGI
ncbi:right-handed parallel beta-helix repeat-containing protein [Aliifodinibius sp. S!AR15-10]|uniref:right-handed parallel beta-helix repeat-containing protein n=1 Tax=Aliifodinibius sp. S!AR15-10 TaxID=2950437 RepID=UPI0028545B6A|nr:right-handed parallel beta-helix repeat-containing protein [Aliifodinibius sp. S!AR15-10]MDR8393247.1 right-handed parallel beta-helix repeat-containing protein [Aliifodinibius sp. S!AR15-10]